MRKKNVKAIVLEALYHSDGPMTVGGLQQSTLLSRSSLKDCLARLTLERCVEKKKFSIEGIDCYDYRVSDVGRTPKYYYVIRFPLGMKKLQYFADVGLIKLQ
ncbi:MAG: hypothetical protein JW840_03370 [Candidatus Thermoplasmatota archaeon]|nr:hypothetical protein [Candidatus Thermoplasmatota archaeon]